ncbi:hypothetical protein V1J52_14490 [Streptomyces sp. TRM 70351]|uniref:hypothetical protein n=1 Tax=Streptomyces sp. TRM 70351 TaxID=3116552 RepID=UPI002E7C0B24|nr:hypothetical protein [Streptomyces sp. TRM 70351]MEE1929374.1 hypothetical protein [Streptomyces sp. TRM 70351]
MRIKLSGLVGILAAAAFSWGVAMDVTSGTHYEQRTTVTASGLVLAPLDDKGTP